MMLTILIIIGALVLSILLGLITGQIIRTGQGEDERSGE